MIRLQVGNRQRDYEAVLIDGLNSALGPHSHVLKLVPVRLVKRVPVPHGPVLVVSERVPLEATAVWPNIIYIDVARAGVAPLVSQLIEQHKLQPVEPKAPQVPGLWALEFTP